MEEICDICGSLNDNVCMTCLYYDSSHDNEKKLIFEKIINLYNLIKNEKKII
jgi:hypothetical protein